MRYFLPRDSFSILALRLICLSNREIDELRSRESAATRRAELESQGIRALEHRLKESLCMIESREADMVRREKAVEEARQGYQETAHREVNLFYILDTLV